MTPPWWLRYACLAALAAVLAFAYLIGEFDAATPIERAISVGVFGLLVLTQGMIGLLHRQGRGEK